MELRKVSDDGRDLVLEHDPVTDPDVIGFRLKPVVRQGQIVEGAWAHTWDASRTRHKFASGFPPYTVESVMRGDVGVYPVASPSPGFELSAHSIKLPSDGIGVWLTYKSPATQEITSDDNTFRKRMIVWDTKGGMPSALYSARRMYAILGFRLVKNFPGRMFNWHNQPNDKPWGWAPPYCPPDWHPTGVSPLAIDYWQDDRGLMLVIEPEGTSQCGGSDVHENQILSKSEMESRRGEWVWLIVEYVWGRRDQGPGGSAKVWISGEDEPRVNRPAPLHTHYYDQHQVTFLTGMYHCENCSGHDRDHETEVAAPRFGRTLQECYEDRPVFVQGGASGQSGGSSSGSFSAIAPRMSDEVKIPASLRW